MKMRPKLGFMSPASDGDFNTAQLILVQNETKTLLKMDRLFVYKDASGYGPATDGSCYNNKCIGTNGANFPYREWRV